MRFVLLTLLLTAAAPAWTDWVRYSETKSAFHYLDPDTILRDGNLVRVWTLQDWNEPGSDGTRSLRILFEFDCQEERMRSVSAFAHSGHMAGGQASVTSDILKRSWVNIVRGSAFASAFKLVCAR